MPYFVYILECADKSLYIGYTNDLQKRVLSHNTLKTGAKYTRGRRPVTLRYSEKLKTLSEALQREAELKKWPRKRKLKLINEQTNPTSLYSSG